MERYHHGALREALLDAAEAHMAAGEEPSLRELARDTAVAPASVYHHFDDKDGLLVALAVRGFERLLAEQRALLASDPDDAVLALADAYLAFTQAHPTLYRVMMRKDLSRPDKYPRLSQVADEAFQLLVGVVRAQRAGDEDDARTEALALWATAHGLASLWELGPLRGKLGEVALRDFARGLFARPRTADRRQDVSVCDLSKKSG